MRCARCHAYAGDDRPVAAVAPCTLADSARSPRRRSRRTRRHDIRANAQRTEPAASLPSTGSTPTRSSGPSRQPPSRSLRRRRGRDHRQHRRHPLREREAVRVPHSEARREVERRGSLLHRSHDRFATMPRVHAPETGSAVEHPSSIDRRVALPPADASSRGRALNARSAVNLHRTASSESSDRERWRLSQSSHGQ